MTDDQPRVIPFRPKRAFGERAFARIPTDLDERLRAYAAEHGVSTAAVIRVALTQFLDRQARERSGWELGNAINRIMVLPTIGEV